MVWARARNFSGAEVAAGDLDLDRREAGLPLGPGVGRDELVELAAVAVRAAVAQRRRRGVCLLVVVEQLEREVPLVDPVALELLLDLAPQLVDAVLVDEDLDAGAGAVLAQPLDRKSTRLNSSHQIISYAVFCLKKKNH